MSGAAGASRARCTDERGLAVPVVVALSGLLVVLSLVAAAGGRLLVEQRRAGSAADLAALSAAAALQRGRVPCAAARATASANGARLSSCLVRGEVVTVETVVVVRTLVGRAVDVRGTARAGPVS